MVVARSRCDSARRLTSGFRVSYRLPLRAIESFPLLWEQHMLLVATASVCVVNGSKAWASTTCCGAEGAARA